MSKKSTLVIADKQYAVRAQIESATYNVEERTVEVIMTTEAPATMWNWELGYYDEILPCDPANMVTKRLEKGLPVLDNHGKWGSVTTQTLGKSISWKCENGQLIGVVKLSSRKELEGFRKDVEEGIIQNLSVGYRVMEYYIEKPSTETTLAVYRATKWEPFEVSFVNVPADGDATTRSLDNEHGDKPKPGEKTRTINVINEVKNSQTNTNTAMDPEEIKKNERERAKKIRAAVKAAGLQVSVAEKLIDDGTSFEEAETQIKALKDAAAATPPPAPENDGAAVTRALAEAQERTTGILQAARMAGMPQKEAEELVASKKSLAVCIKEISDKYEQGDANAGARNHVTMTNENKKTVLDAMCDAFLIRANSIAAAKFDGARRHAATQFIGRSMLQSFRQYFASIGENVSHLGDTEIAQRALTSADLTNVMANTIRYSLAAAYENAPRTFMPWTTRTTNKDFKPTRRTRLSGLMQGFEKINKGGEYKYSSVTDQGATLELGKFGRKIAITQEDLIDDELGAFNQIPQAIANAATTLQSDIIYALLVGNPVLEDGINVFAAGHNNLVTPGTDLDAAGLAATRLKLRNQRNLNGDYMNLTGEFLIVGPELETKALQYTSSEYMPTTQSQVNPWKNLTPIVDPRILGNDWYLAANPSRVDTIHYAFLEGASELYIESQWKFDTDVMETKAKMYFDADWMDYRGVVKNEGA